ncbi:hypothetical protein [Chitinivorax sp. B]|uniref:hypothetical protein n=1 Tax=Chitinivorax sp. B TaxID=2502235 RepID=UPI0010F726C1|nr:hypothetical protein [Chitinivorax sp. B]
MSDFLTSLKRLPGNMPPGTYTMWMPSEVEPFFTPSVTRHLISQVYQAINQIETYTFSLLLKKLGYIESDISRVNLPVDLTEFPVTLEEAQPFLMTASREKGIRLHFDDATDPINRNQILASFLALVESVQQLILERKLPLDAVDGEMPINWWYACDQTLTAVENNGEPIKALGKVIIE